VYLSERGIEYELRDIREDQAALFELVRKWESRSTPTLVIMKPEGEEVMIGFDPERLEQILAE
jgi:glutaredoxin